MTNLVPTQTHLPETIEDLSLFVLVGREKLNAVKAEIRAIDKVQLAADVRDQKRDEARMLSEALLDAEVRLGELMKQIPKGSGGDRKSQEIKKDTAVLFDNAPKQTKQAAIHTLGFSEKQAQRFETLADNRDLVEQVKAEARENDDLPTRSRVLDLAQQRKKREEESSQPDEGTMEYLDECGKIANRFNNVIYDAGMLNTDDYHFKAWKQLLLPTVAESTLRMVNEAIPKLLKVQKFLKEVVG